LEPESVSLAAALGRVLARDVLSPLDLPPWDNASMDGYAVHAVDVAHASAPTPVELPVVETIAAGSAASRPLGRGEAMRIMTGAPIPAGADSVIRVEDTDRGDVRVTIRSARDAARNVRPRGEDLEAGAIALTAGTTVGPAQLGVLASVGAARVEVHRLPRVGVLSTGEELVDVDRFDEVRRGRRIVNSNGYTIRGAVALSGAEVVDLGLAHDDRATLRERFDRARDARCDLLITTGGVSVGEFDFTREVLRELGTVMRFWRVRIRPGGPLGFGLLDSMPWLGLPGNPVSALVTFELFARPAIRRLRGECLLFPQAMPVVVDEPITIGAPLTHFLRAVVTVGADGVAHARLTGPQGSGLLTSMARANALLIVPLERYGTPAVAPGEYLRAIPVGNEPMLAPELLL
jgi:molybdopterin molybdotransferase